MENISNEELRVELMPSSDADWPEIWRLADSFNGYKHWGTFEACAEIANQQRSSTLTELRTCLFFECRRWHHFGDDPDDDESVYIRGLVQKISEFVAAGRIE